MVYSKQTEWLYSNLLKVAALPEHLYTASTNHRFAGALWTALQQAGGEIGPEWLLTSKRIVSFRDLREHPWNTICNPSTVRIYDMSEWAETDDPDRRRDFVRLLNHCLRAFTRSRNLSYRKDLDCYYFPPTPDLKPRAITYRSLQQDATRDVFAVYYKKNDPEAVSYFRHAAFCGSFQRYGREWYLQITPTYVYTVDGYKLSKFQGELLAGIKRFDRNAALVGQIVMWGGLPDPRDWSVRRCVPVPAAGEARAVSGQPADRRRHMGFARHHGAGEQQDHKRVSVRRNMNITFLDEPSLEFGGSGRHIDIRFGITGHGPLDRTRGTAPRRIRVGMVGSAETIEGTLAWLNRCKSGVAAKPSHQPNLFPRFPGFTADLGFLAELVTEGQLQRVLPGRTVREVSLLPSHSQFVVEAVQAVVEEARHLTENTSPDVIVCALPQEFVTRIDDGEDLAGPEGDGKAAGPPLVFHDLLKAKAMDLHKPIQVIRPTTYGAKSPKAKRRRKPRGLQDDATRAWNFHTALYYKAGGVPWRLVRDSTEPMACFVGVSFYQNLDRSAVLTSTAQVFNERGDGVIIRGGKATISRVDRAPHLEEADAKSLLTDALKRYRSEHKTLPARAVVHKSSTYTEGELAGFQAAVDEHGVDSADFITLQSASTKLFRAGVYPPWRGTLLTLDAQSQILYTRGSVEFFAAYPGMYVPVPRWVRCQRVEQTPAALAAEILALTKMNWNSSQFDNMDPITLRAAKQVGDILKHVPPGGNLEPRYSYYM